MTNTVPFLLNELSKIQIFTDILYPFCQRLLRPADVTFLKTKNVHISKIYNLRFSKILSNKIILSYFNLSEPIHNVQFNVRYPVLYGQNFEISDIVRAIGARVPAYFEETSARSVRSLQSASARIFPEAP